MPPSGDHDGVRIRPPGMGIPGVASQGQPYVTRLSPAETTGRLGVVEVTEVMRRTARLHVHPADEAWYVLDGAYALLVAGAWRRLEPETFVFVPGGVPHGFAVTSATARKLSFSLPPAAAAGNLDAMPVVLDDVDVPSELWDEWRVPG